MRPHDFSFDLEGLDSGDAEAPVEGVDADDLALGGVDGYFEAETLDESGYGDGGALPTPEEMPFGAHGVGFINPAALQSLTQDRESAPQQQQSRTSQRAPQPPPTVRVVGPYTGRPLPFRPGTTEANLRAMMPGALQSVAQSACRDVWWVTKSGRYGGRIDNPDIVWGISDLQHLLGQPITGVPDVNLLRGIRALITARTRVGRALERDFVFTDQGRHSLWNKSSTGMRWALQDTYRTSRGRVYRVPKALLEAWVCGFRPRNPVTGKAFTKLDDFANATNEMMRGTPSGSARTAQGQAPFGPELQAWQRQTRWRQNAPTRVTRPNRDEVRQAVDWETRRQREADQARVRAAQAQTRAAQAAAAQTAAKAAADKKAGKLSLTARGILDAGSARIADTTQRKNWASNSRMLGAALALAKQKRDLKAQHARELAEEKNRAKQATEQLLRAGAGAHAEKERNAAANAEQREREALQQTQRAEEALQSLLALKRVEDRVDPKVVAERTGEAAAAVADDPNEAAMMAEDIAREGAYAAAAAERLSPEEAQAQIDAFMQHEGRAAVDASQRVPQQSSGGGGSGAGKAVAAILGLIALSKMAG